MRLASKCKFRETGRGRLIDNQPAGRGVCEVELELEGESELEGGKIAMARRRRRLKVKNSALLFALILIVNLVISSSIVNASQQHNYQQLEQQANLYANHQELPNQEQAKPPVHHLNNNNNNNNNQHQHANNHHANHHHANHHGHHHQQAASEQASQLAQAGSPSTAHLCGLLPLQAARHLKLCKLIANSVNADEAVALGASRGLAECRDQFKSERWNCTHTFGDHQLLTSELAQSVGNRESGFVQAIVAAGIVHSIATACSVGNLSDCACDKTRIGSIRRQDENWKWGGCSNNIRHGMLFAKHLVELLDAIHQHARQQQVEASNLVASSANTNQRRLAKRSLLLLAGKPTRPARQQQQIVSPDGALNEFNFCQKSQNLSQTAHMQLIKSLLSKNSLERHQEFRLAMNMHNNKVGRMAVAKNMEFRCRCHGLSGSCSLKTCWLILPNFQVIGAYLKRKYEGSIHLPSVVNVNKLIPMMDRNEISAILSGQPTGAAAAATSAQPSASSPSASSGTQSPSGASGSPAPPTTVAPVEPQADEQVRSGSPELAPLVASSPGRVQLSGHFVMPPQAANLSHFNYYERHKQLTSTTPKPTAVAPPTPAQVKPVPQSGQPPAAADEIPANVAPMTQQQYQALLRDMKLCNNNNATTSQHQFHLTTRDLNQQTHHHHMRAATNQAKSGRHQLQGSGASSAAGGLSGPQHLKLANQQLSQLLHSNKEDLIHLHRSPDYCEADPRHGFAGIQSRVCSDDPAAPGNCDKLCCGRGYTTHTYQHSYKCDCKFQYCCSIWCSICEKEIKLLVCN